MALIDIDWRPPPRQLRQFAAIGLVVFGALGTLTWYKGGSMLLAKILWGLSAYVGGVGLLIPQLVWPIYVVMMAVALPIGMVVSTVLLLAIYYLLMTPVGLVMRLTGYDALKGKPDPSAATYWIQRSAPASMKRYFRQY